MRYANICRAISIWRAVKTFCVRTLAIRPGCAAPAPLTDPIALVAWHPQANDQLRRDFEEFRGAPPPLVVAQQQKAEWQADMEKFQKLIENMQVSRSSALYGEAR